MKRAMLVYQAGIANVFEVKSFNLANYGRDAHRLCQHTFGHCQAYCHGLGDAGVIVRTAGCNQAGDIIDSHWTEDLDSLPFSHSLIDINHN